MRTRYAVVSAHVERLLDDACWRLLSRLQERAWPFRIAALVRPPDPGAGEDETLWLERARATAGRGPFGLHTHWTSPDHARPTGGDPGERVRDEVAWLRERGLDPTLFSGGGWYADEGVAEALAELGLADCTATSFRPGYLADDAPRLGLGAPAWVELPSGARLLELPTTHSIGMLTRGVLKLRLAGPVVHAYFHDTDLADRRRRAALQLALCVLAARCRVIDLERLRRRAADADLPVVPFADVAQKHV
jgi:hypothetical protein